MAQVRAAIPAARIQEHFAILLDGFTVELPARSLPKLLSVQAVTKIYPSLTYTATMDRGPSVIHATDLEAATGQKGEGIKIAVIDTGVDSSSPFLNPAGFSYPPGFPKGDTKLTTPKVIVAKVFPGPVRDASSNKAFDPTEPHGTHVAGIAAGDENTTAPAGTDHPQVTGLSGVAPKAWIGNYRVFTVPTPLGHEADTPEIVNAFEAAVADGMNVINFSGGGPQTDPANDAMYEAIHNTSLAGVVPVIAAGNDREDFGLGTAGSPGTAPDAISVAATSNSHVFAPALSVVGGPPSLGAIPIQNAGGARLPSAWATLDQTVVDVSSIVGTDGKPVESHLCGSASDPNTHPRHAAEGLRQGEDPARLPRRLHIRLQGGAGAARRSDRDHPRRQPLRRGQPDPDSAADPGRDDRRSGRPATARLRRRERRSGDHSRDEQHPGDPDQPRRRHHELLVGRADRFRAHAQAGHLGARARRALLHAAQDDRRARSRSSPARRWRRLTSPGRRRSCCSSIPAGRRGRSSPH